jgi:hypothetical protein
MELDNGAAIAWNANNAGQRFGIGQSNGGLFFFRTASDPGSVSNAANYDLTISDSGRVGIGAGATTPAFPLTIDTGFFGYGLVHTDGAVQLGTYVDAKGGWLGTRSNHPLRFFTSDSQPQMTVATSGAVGIGTESPSLLNKLEVVAGSPGINWSGVSARITDGVALRGFAEEGYGVYGVSNDTSNGAGVFGMGRLAGVYGEASLGSGSVGIFGDDSLVEPNSDAGRFSGDVQVNGVLTKLSGAFRIDHPLDPANKYLEHSFVESPDMMNIYNGNAITDASGYATIGLPNWFEALNKDFRYQLTVLGQFAQAIVASKIEDNRFVIRTDHPNVEVSWQVTGIRKDAWAQAHPVEVEQDKPEHERGTYLAPELFGQPVEKSVDYRFTKARRSALNPDRE